LGLSEEVRPVTIASYLLLEFGAKADRYILNLFRDPALGGYAAVFGLIGLIPTPKPVRPVRRD
jgi:hypothetical protein